MVSNVLLTGSIRSNLLSIVDTQRTLDRTTLRLATGLKVNSALDNPQNFFTASSLDNRASDLQRLLDDINLNIRTVQETDVGVKALTSLVEQAEAIAIEAVELNAQSPTDAIVAGDVDLSAVADLTTLSGIDAGDQLLFAVRDPDNIVYFPAPVAVTITAGMSGDGLVAAINTTVNAGQPTPIIDAELSVNGHLQIAAIDGDILNIEFASVPPSDAANLALANALGFGDKVQVLGDGFGANEVQLTVIASRTLTSFELFDAVTNRVARRSDNIAQLEGANNTLLFFGLNSPADNFQIGVNGQARQSITLDTGQTLQGLIDGINNNATLNGVLRADFIDETGQLTIEAIDSSVETIETGLIADAVAVAFLGFNVSAPLYVLNADVDSINLGTVSGPSLDQINQLENDYDKVLRQIDNITEDANVRGINILAGDDLESFFNEDRSNSLLTDGVDFTFSGLGLETASFRTQASAQIGVNNARDALKAVREFGQSVANDLTIIQTRRDFIESSINTLESGSDDLVNADLNEEGANMLALQTRQSLSTTALSIGALQNATILTIFA